MALATEAVAVEAPWSPAAVSWAAIIGGALTAVAVTLLLVALGTGIGLSSVSPWSSTNPSATTFTLLAAVWLIIVQWLSSGLGGYLTGRLRTKWAGLHTDEVFFRDTATASSPGRSPRFWSPPSPRPRLLRPLAPQRERFRM